MGLVSVAVFMLVMPLFKATGGILLQMAPPSIPASAMSKCSRKITALDDVTEVNEARLWELVSGYLVGSLSLQAKSGVDDKSILEFVHSLWISVSRTSQLKLIMSDIFMDFCFCCGESKDSLSTHSL